jgi:flagellin
MGIRINQNVMAMNAYRNLTSSEGSLSKSLERLSSGFRINRAADDAAGLVISEGLRSQVMGLKMATRNAQDGVSVVQTAEGALTETHSILQRIRELAVQAASTGSSDQPSRDAAQVEVVQLKAELDRIASTTKFGAQTLLDGNYGVTPASLAGTAATTSITVAAGSTDAFNLDVDGTGGTAAFANVQIAAGTYNADSTAGGTAGTQDATRLENAIRAGIDTALGPVLGGTNRPVDVKVTITGAGATSKFVTTFTGTKGNSIGVTTPTNTFSALPSLGVTSTANVSPTGSGGVFQVGSGTSASDQINIKIADVSSTGIAVGSTGLNLSAVDVSQSGLSTSNLNSIDAAITKVSTLRGNLGAYQNRFEHTIANLSITTENLSASESRIRDTDMASEMMSFTRAQILQQAGTAMLAQANAVPQTVLQLLK